MSAHEIGAFVCSHIFEASRPILLVSREDGDWMFLCGAMHAEGEKYRFVGINHLVERDPGLRETLDLPDHFEAERDEQGGRWRRQPLT
jgi:hypothetical protein